MKRVTKLTDKARAALEDKSGSGSSKKRRTEDVSSTNSDTVTPGPDQETSKTTLKHRHVEVKELEELDKKTSKTALKRRRVEVEEVEEVEELDDNMISSDDETETTTDSKKDLTPEEELGKCQNMSEWGFAHISLQRA